LDARVRADDDLSVPTRDRLEVDPFLLSEQS
jgi:hypothetical protein